MSKRKAVTRSDKGARGTQARESQEALPTPEEIEEALSVVLDEARSYNPVARGACESCEHRPCIEKREWAIALYKAERLLDRAKLVAVPEGENVYTSRFKPGDAVYWLNWYNSLYEDVVQAVGQNKESCGVFIGGVMMYDVHCFPTRAEAEAECAKRNKGA